MPIQIIFGHSIDFSLFVIDIVVDVIILRHWWQLSFEEASNEINDSLEYSVFNDQKNNEKYDSSACHIDQIAANARLFPIVHSRY